MGKINQIKSGAVQVFEKNEQFWTTSLDVAEKFGKRHDNVLRDIENLECSEKFKLLNFEELSQTVRGGTQKYYIISRDGFSFLAMGFKGREAAEWKEKYIEAFNKMEQTIKKLLRQRKRQVDLEWKQARDDGKISRRQATDAIQEFCELAKAQGSKHSHFYFKSLTNAIYDAVIIPGGHREIDQRRKELKKSNGRETLSLEELIKVELMEKLVLRKFLKEASVDKESYKDIYPVVKQKLLRYGEIVEKRLSLGINNQHVIAVNQ